MGIVLEVGTIPQVSSEKENRQISQSLCMYMCWNAGYYSIFMLQGEASGKPKHWFLNLGRKLDQLLGFQVPRSIFSTFLQQLKHLNKVRTVEKRAVLLRTFCLWQASVNRTCSHLTRRPLSSRKAETWNGKVHMWVPRQGCSILQEQDKTCRNVCRI
jgi:hypothetical protein